MFKKRVVLLGLLTGLLLPACGADKTPTEDPALVYTMFASEVERDPAPDVLPEDFAGFVAAGNEFAMTAYRQMLDTSADGQVFSPLSLRNALAMLYAGAEDDTKQQMADALGFELPDDRLHPAFNALLAQLDSRNLPAGDQHAALSLTNTNALWPRLGSEPNSAYLDVLGKNYGAGVYALDYGSDPDLARRTINDKVEEWTHGRISDLLAEGSVPQDTLMVLTSALRLYAPWNLPFAQGATAPKVFHNLDGSQVEAATMVGDLVFQHRHDSGLEVLAIPFRGRELEMVFLVPDADFEAYAAQLDAESVTQALAETTQVRAIVHLPKFTLNYTLQANEVLQALGMTRAFTTAAQFEAMGFGRLMVSEVAHQAFIAVDEDGVEAAAATAIIGLPVSAPQFETHLDRPFVFIIRDAVTGVFLFVGHVANLSG